MARQSPIRLQNQTDNFTFAISHFTLISHFAFSIDSQPKVCEMLPEIFMKIENCKMANASEGSDL